MNVMAGVAERHIHSGIAVSERIAGGAAHPIEQDRETAVMHEVGVKIPIIPVGDRQGDLEIGNGTHARTERKVFRVAHPVGCPSGITLLRFAKVLVTVVWAVAMHHRYCQRRRCAQHLKTTHITLACAKANALSGKSNTNLSKNEHPGRPKITAPGGQRNGPQLRHRLPERAGVPPGGAPCHPRASCRLCWVRCRLIRRKQKRPSRFSMTASC